MSFLDNTFNSQLYFNSTFQKVDCLIAELEQVCLCKNVYEFNVGKAKENLQFIQGIYKIK